MKVLSITIVGIRFILELVTILGLLGGLFTQKTYGLKLALAFMCLLIIIVWGRYGAPKSPFALKGFSKICLEIFIFSLGTLGFLLLYGGPVGAIYALLALVDLLLLYALRLA